LFSLTKLLMYFFETLKILEIDESKQAHSMYNKNYSGIYTTLNQYIQLHNFFFSF